MIKSQRPKCFNRIIDKAGKESKIRELTEALTLLNSLRNKETHFYISENEYLTDNDFIILHNLMIFFYEIMEEYELLPALYSTVKSWLWLIPFAV